MKKIAVFFAQEGAMDYPFTKQEYWESYKEFDTDIRALGGEFFIVRGNSSYAGNGHFANSWQFEDGKLTEMGPVTVDVIYDKGVFVTDGAIPVLNSQYINDICTDKWRTFETFPESCPKTVLVQTEEDFSAALETVPGDRKVVKPLDQEEGNGVFIGTTEYLLTCPHEFPVLVQEFLDSTCGIEGIVEGIHDFGILIMDGEILLSVVRTPPPGELLTNVARGGQFVVVPKEKIPAEALKIAEKVEKDFASHGHRFYRVDVAQTPTGFKIIELNSRPGLLRKSHGDLFVQLHRKLAELLMKL